MIDAIDLQLAPFDVDLRAYARKQPGCRALADQIYGVDGLVAVTLVAELGDTRRFDNSRDVVRYSGLDITVYQPDQHRAPGHLSRQGPPALRWAPYEAAQRARFPASPDRAYYVQAAERIAGNRACIALARKLLLRAILTDVVVTVDRESAQHTAELRVVWEGGTITEHTVPLSRTGSHTRCTDQDTIALVRQLAQQYPDKQIAAILARQGRRTGAGNPFTAHNIHGLQTYHKIPAAHVRATGHDSEVVTIATAAAELGVSTATVHHWLREGFITGEQITPGAPWQIRLTPELRARVRDQAPDGWLPLTQAAQALCVARQTVLHKVQRGELAAVYVQNSRRKCLRIQVKPDQTGLFDNPIRQQAQC